MDAVGALVAGMGLVVLAALIGRNAVVRRSRTASAASWLSGPGPWLRRAVLTGYVAGGLEIALAFPLTAGESTPTTLVLALAGYATVFVMCGMAARKADVPIS